MNTKPFAVYPTRQTAFCGNMEECRDGTDTAVYRGCWTINSAHLLIYCHCSRDQLPRHGTTAWLVALHQDVCKHGSQLLCQPFELYSPVLHLTSTAFSASFILKIKKIMLLITGCSLWHEGKKPTKNAPFGRRWENVNHFPVEHWINWAPPVFIKAISWGSEICT